MTRIAIGAVISLLVATTPLAHADTEPDADVVAAATEANVSPADLLGALNALEDAGIPTAPFAYLRATGELAPLPAPPVSACGWPICGPLGQRIYCIEKVESNHGAAMYNRTPVWDGEHASGWLGWLPSTARSVGVSIGSRASEWQGAARMIALGRGREFYGIAAGIC